MPLLSVYYCDDGGEERCQVWLALEEGDPTRQQESFIIGTGPDLEKARADAIAALQTLIAELQGPPLPAGTVCHGRD